VFLFQRIAPLQIVKGGVIVDDWRIQDIPHNDPFYTDQAVNLLYKGFHTITDSYRTIELAYEEVKDCMVDERINRCVLDRNNRMMGWIGALPQYNGNAWELHPLIVDPNFRNLGIGRLLITDLEHQIAKQGGCVIYLGTDDEKGLTSLYGIDLFQNLWNHIQQIRNPGNHPYTFYQKFGFQIIGVLPDANGLGKPDIFMAKRIEHEVLRSR